MAWAGLAAHAATLEEQRQLYMKAQQALKAGRLETFETLAGELRDYPLYPYLRYEYIRPRLAKLSDDLVGEFLQSYPDLPMADGLRTQWLLLLAQRGRWESFIAHYTHQQDPRLRCLYLRARMETGRREYLLEDTRTLWLTGKSLPDECNPAFELLYDSPLMTSDLVWQRIRLAMDSGQTGLASHLSRRLPDAERKWVARWIEAHGNPDGASREPRYEDTPIAREILLHALRRLARANLNRALERWARLQEQYSFLPAERNLLDRELAVRAARARHPRMLELLDSVAQEAADSEVFHHRLRLALHLQDWPRLVRWTQGLPPFGIEDNQWYYWRGRALAASGQNEEANRIFAELARQRDYYGFLAADRLGLPYSMNNYHVPVSVEQKEMLTKRRSGILRAHELLALNHKPLARREWQHTLDGMSLYELQIAASIAADWGWHDRAIVTLAKARAFDDLELRFPVLYRDTLEEYARERDLDPAWLLGLVRAESAFMEDARSPAGALGLMQVMPATGQMTARRLGMKNFNSKHLLEADKNIPIGSMYLKMMYEDFERNVILATAAYNAGPHRVKTWLPKSDCMEPDVWIESIPFDETRTYVKRVLSYATIYDFRMEREIKPMTQRMAAITPRGGPALVASLSCGADSVSLNLRHAD
jgi:soluble lytic murein transglycosylase